jgi:DNA-binding response OmpR family regulator
VRILVIDDDLFIGAAIKITMDRHRWTTVHMLRAHAGINAFELSKFDVVIVDIFMPGMNGLDTIMRIRKLASTVPIVAMTGFRFRDSEDPVLDFLVTAIERGATFGLRKPFAPSQLMRAINSARGVVSSAAAPTQ